MGAVRKGSQVRRFEARHANDVDAHVGHRIRERRAALGMSQEQLAVALGLTFQQVQKYEHGTNRVSASRLYQLSQILKVEVSWFFEGLAGQGGADSRGVEALAAGDAGANQMHSRETIDLVRVYYRIPNARVRKRLYEVAKSLAASED